MNILQIIEGLSNENLTSAVLRLLILRSLEIRDKIISLISDSSPIGPLSSEALFSCYQEQTISDDQGVQGRLDLVLEIDDAVIGIENKLYAGFQQDQIERYMAGLETAAGKRSEIWGRRTRCLLVVIGPESRNDEISGHLKHNLKRSVFISWETLLEKLERDIGLDEETKIIKSALVEFVRERISFCPMYYKWFPHFRKVFESRGTIEQKEFLRAIRRFFPYGGKRMFGGNDWVGYDIKVNGYYAWFGFVRSSELKTEISRRGLENEADLIIATTFPVEFSNTDISRIQVADEKRWWPWVETRYFWRVNLDESWSNPQKWVKELIPLNQAVKELEKKCDE